MERLNERDCVDRLFVREICCPIVSDIKKRRKVTGDVSFSFTSINVRFKQNEIKT